MGVYGEILYPLSNSLEILPQNLPKTLKWRGEFELDRAQSKNNIAENSVALGHDTHNKYYVWILFQPIGTSETMWYVKTFYGANVPFSVMLPKLLKKLNFIVLQKLKF